MENSILHSRKSTLRVVNNIHRTLRGFGKVSVSQWEGFMRLSDYPQETWSDEFRALAADITERGGAACVDRDRTVVPHIIPYDIDSVKSSNPK